MKRLTVTFLSSDYQDRWIDLSVNGTRYRYHFHDIKYAEEQYNALKRWPGRALSWVKKNSHKYERL